MPHVLAFYLPQFHQAPENDAWYGAGFTEWTFVARTEPLFPGHRQPHLPGELGFYDLRVPETRERQATLARDHGVSGFLYYHYWFRGRRTLERPFNEVLRSGSPDFPFALCWANESWFRCWQGSSDEMLMEQEYDRQDDLEHIRWLIEAFKDPRYIKIHGRPLLTIYRPELLPEPKVTFDLWREECAKAGVAEPWLVMFETWTLSKDPSEFGFDASAEFVPHGLFELVTPLENPLGVDPSHWLFDYQEVATAYASREEPQWNHYPCVATDWDNTPRRAQGEAQILHGSSPEAYGRWLESAIRRQGNRNGNEGIVFVNAWNEWAEGAHLEPDSHHGRAYLEMTREVVEAVGGVPLAPESPVGRASPEPVPIEDLYTELYDRFVRLQATSSGLQARADRRLSAVRQEYEARLHEAREESRRLAAASLLLEERLARATQRSHLQHRSPEPGRPFPQGG